MSLSFASVPWALVLSVFAVSAILLLLRFAPEALARMGLGREEALLITLGTVAGQAINVPLFAMGRGYLALNVGGALLAIVLAYVWFARERLSLWKTALGTSLVAVVAEAVVRFDPDFGIIAPFPGLFAPFLVAFAFAFLISIPRVTEAPALAFTCGSLGAFLGADAWNVAQMHAHFEGSNEAAIVSLGGAGVFDMVFLAGAVPLVFAALAALPAVGVRRPPGAPVGSDASTTGAHTRAPILARVIAGVLDIVLVAAFATVVVTILRAAGLLSDPAFLSGGILTGFGAAAWLAIVVAAPVGALILPAMESAWGFTPGKALLGLRVTCAEDGTRKPPLLRAFLRNLLRFLAVTPLLAGLIPLALIIVGADVLFMMITRNGSRVGDWAARTVVVPR